MTLNYHSSFFLTFHFSDKSDRHNILPLSAQPFQTCVSFAHECVLSRCDIQWWREGHGEAVRREMPNVILGTRALKSNQTTNNILNIPLNMKNTQASVYYQVQIAFLNYQKAGKAEMVEWRTGYKFLSYLDINLCIQKCNPRSIKNRNTKFGSQFAFRCVKLHRSDNPHSLYSHLRTGTYTCDAMYFRSRERKLKKFMKKTLNLEKRIYSVNTGTKQ